MLPARAFTAALRHRPLLRACLLTVVLLGAAPALAATITDLTDDVVLNGRAIGEVRLHAGTHNYRPDGSGGLGRATPHGEKSGFYPAGGGTLQQAAAAAGGHHFNWLQIVTAQPGAHEARFGAVPHADPSSDPSNIWPHDQQPWYLNESSAGTTPEPVIHRSFDLPAVTAGMLPFQDFPSGFYRAGERIAFDTYLISIRDTAARTFRVHQGFRWELTYDLWSGESRPRARITQLESIDLGLPQAYHSIVAAYGGTGWSIVPEPSTAVLCFACGALLSARRRMRGA